MTNYNLIGMRSEYFHTEGITSLTSLLMEMAIWLENTNACVESISIEHQVGDDYWAGFILHDSTLTGKYDKVEVEYDLTRAQKLAQALVEELAE